MADIRLVISSPGSRKLSFVPGGDDVGSRYNTFSIPGSPRLDNGQDAPLYRNWRNSWHLKQTKCESVRTACLVSPRTLRRTVTFDRLT